MVKAVQAAWPAHQVRGGRWPLGGRRSFRLTSPRAISRAMRGGLWRLLAVIHGPSGHFDALACAALLPDRWSPPPPRPVDRAHDSVLVPPW